MSAGGAPWFRRLGRAPAVVVVSWFFVASYVFISRGCENFFPFSAMDMYAGWITRTSSRILAETASGRVVEVERFTHWRCDRRPDPSHVQCEGLSHYESISYVDRDLIEHIWQHPGTGTEPGAVPLTLVRRVWYLDDRVGPPRHVQCLLVRCRAVPQ